jgi:flagellar secretion chaperone FliS
LGYDRYLHEYQKGAVNGASPLQLVVMLYDGALRFMEAGKHAMIQKDIDKQNLNLQKAQRILTELTTCLDMEQGGEVAANLLALYTFATNKLIEANIADDPNGIDVCIEIMSGLRQSWVTIEAQTKVRSAQGQHLAA